MAQKFGPLKKPEILIIIKKYIRKCGAREFVTPTHFTLGPEPRRDIAEDIQRKSKWPRDIAGDDSVLGIPKRS